MSEIIQKPAESQRDGPLTPKEAEKLITHLITQRDQLRTEYQELVMSTTILEKVLETQTQFLHGFMLGSEIRAEGLEDEVENLRELNDALDQRGCYLQEQVDSLWEEVDELDDELEDAGDEYEDMMSEIQGLKMVLGDLGCEVVVFDK